MADLGVPLFQRIFPYRRIWTFFCLVNYPTSFARTNVFSNWEHHEYSLLWIKLVSHQWQLGKPMENQVHQSSYTSPWDYLARKTLTPISRSVLLIIQQWPRVHSSALGPSAVLRCIERTTGAPDLDHFERSEGHQIPQVRCCSILHNILIDLIIWYIYIYIYIRYIYIYIYNRYIIDR